MNNLSLREATVEDAAAIAMVHVSSWRATYDGLMPAEYLAGLSVDKRTALWHTALETQQVRVTLAGMDDQLAGWAAFGKCRDTDKDATWGEVEAIYLLPAFWRQGIGKRLIVSAGTSLREAGYLHASLWVLTENYRARTFYERMGFVCDDVVKEFELGGVRLSETRYCYDLAAINSASAEREDTQHVER